MEEARDVGQESIETGLLANVFVATVPIFACCRVYRLFTVILWVCGIGTYFLLCQCSDPWELRRGEIACDHCSTSRTSLLPFAGCGGNARSGLCGPGRQVSVHGRQRSTHSGRAGLKFQRNSHVFAPPFLSWSDTDQTYELQTITSSLFAPNVFVALLFHVTLCTCLIIAKNLGCRVTQA